MVLDSIFSPNLVKVSLEGDDKEEVFEELVNLYAVANPAASRAALLSALHEREAKLSTGIKLGVAVPHAQTELVSDVTGIIGISRKGIDYDALDGKPVHVVFMLFSSYKGCALHLRVLKRLVMLLEDPGFLSAIVDQKNPEGVIGTIRRYEDILATSM